MRRPIPDCVVRDIKTDGKCNVPYVQGLDALYRNHGCSFVFGETVHFSISGTVRNTMPKEAFEIVNMASLVMIQFISITIDIIDHNPMFRRVMEDVEMFEFIEVRSVNILKKTAVRKASKFTK